MNLNVPSGSLNDYTRRPDCFRKAAASIQSHCAELDMNESERVNVAISMTLCEVATATHYTVPLECIPFMSRSQLQHLTSDVIRLQGDCVDALSRSAQFWSSYSGYLRETPQLCFAFRRWNDIDVARDIYKNVTMDQTDFLQHIIAREKIAELSMTSLESRLDDLNEVVSHIRTASKNINSSVSHWESWFNTNFDHTLGSFREAVSILQEEQEQRSLRLLEQTSTSLQDLNHHHADELRALTHLMKSSLLQHVDKMLIEFKVQSQASVDITDRVQYQWASLSNGLNSMNQSQSVVKLSAIGSEVAHTLESSIRQVKLLNQAQVEASLSVNALAATISNLTMTTHEEMKKVVNVSAVLVQENAHMFTDFYTLSWFFLGLLRLLESIIHVDLESLGYLVHIPLSSAFCLFGLVFRATFSGFLTFGFFCLQKCLTRYRKTSKPPSVKPTILKLRPLKHQSSSAHSSLDLDPRLHRQVLSRISRIPERLYRPMQ
ncbi:Nuclear fusion protein KAR5 [Termitomyces sp. J132]|nr:Nuclear fusion protein KAR5 [Termitomyces sp. J132]